MMKKNLLASVVGYLLLNLIFALLYHVVVLDNLSTWFDFPGIVIMDIFLPGGSGLATLPIFTGILISYEFLETLDFIIILLWALVPGIASSMFACFKFADESSKTGFWASTLGIFLINLIGLLILYFTDFTITLNYLSVAQLFLLIFIAFFESSFYGGWGAMMSSTF